MAGQSPRGYERVVLEHGELPAPFVANVRAVETARTQRRARWAVVRQTDPTLTALLQAVPRLAAGVAMQRQPVLAAGEFVWGDVLLTAGYPEGLPCSPLVARLVSLLDGQRSVAELLAMLLAETEPGQREQRASGALTALEVLYIDGTIATLADG